jgi:hypothetical protein
MGRMSDTKKRRRVDVVRHFKIHERLDPVHHAALESLVRGRDRNMKGVVQWLAALGCPVRLSTVCRYRDHVLAEDDRKRARDFDAFREAETAVAYARIAKWDELPDFTATTITLCQMLTTVSIVLLRYEPDITPQKLRRYVDAFSALVRVSYADVGRAAPRPGTRRPPESLN